MRDDGVDPSAIRSEYALALRLTELHRDDLLYIAERNEWMMWDGALWRQENTLAVFDLARELCRAESKRSRDDREMMRLASANTVAAVEGLARTDRRHVAVADQWDADPMLFNTPDGVVDLRTGELRPNRREDYMTKASACGPGASCPTWLEFLRTITNGDQELQKFLQVLVGIS